MVELISLAFLTLLLFFWALDRLYRLIVVKHQSGALYKILDDMQDETDVDFLYVIKLDSNKMITYIEQKHRTGIKHTVFKKDMADESCVRHLIKSRSYKFYHLPTHTFVLSQCELFRTYMVELNARQAFITYLCNEQYWLIALKTNEEDLSSKQSLRFIDYCDKIRLEILDNKRMYK